MNKKWILFIIPAIIFITPFLIVEISAYITENEPNHWSDPKHLRQKALEAGFKPNPKSFEELLKIVDNPKNPITKEKIKLGKKLFFDPILSKDNSINCAFCHILEEGGDDNRPTAIGYHNQANPFHLNSPTVLNAALQKFQFWDARVKTVEEQAAGPITAPFEMAMTKEEVVNRLEKKDTYKKLFKEVFGEDKITFDMVTNAIGAYERTLLTRGRFDRFLEGDLDALSKDEQKGLELFIDMGCKACHMGRSIGGLIIQKFPVKSYSNIYLQFGFKNGKYVFEKIVFDSNTSDSPFPFENIGNFLGKDKSLRFKVPMLRNIARTSPYFHNGVVKDLKEVIKIMAKYQRGINLNEEQTKQLKAFLQALNGELVRYKY